MYVTQNISCLIFVGKGRRRKIFNDENFAIYGIVPMYFWSVQVIHVCEKLLVTLIS